MGKTADGKTANGKTANGKTAGLRLQNAISRARFGFLIHDVSRMRRTFFDQALKPSGITRAQWWALGNLSRHAEEGMIQTELAKLLDTGKVSVGGLIDRLEESGLVFRKSDPADRRIKRIFITEQGFALLERISVVGNELDKQLFGEISDAELATAIDVLARAKAKLRAALHGTDPAGDANEDAMAQAAAFRTAKRPKKSPAAR
jgi:DNA-binding MarR family transcriptional regulator